MEIDYYVLCFGRTDFTRFTVDSILERAGFTPRITLINNGWIPGIIPDALHGYWAAFVDDYLRQKKVARVINLPFPPFMGTLNAFSQTPFLTDSPFYFITDNDCLPPREAEGQPFDAYCCSIMRDHPSFYKIGLRLYRKISLAYAEQFGFTACDRKTMEALSYLDDDRFVPDHSDLPDLFDAMGQPRIVYEKDDRILLMNCDTTFSLVRKPVLINKGNRLCKASFARCETLHIGYFEPFYFNEKEPRSTEELVLYHRIRALTLPEFHQNYVQREKKYLENREALRAARRDIG
ncbi:MAG: hypothetical protein HY343_03835 [Lentisphaerae bacterium]|nr:hypothetical protein [Lentisphaerota bacterium]